MAPRPSRMDATRWPPPWPLPALAPPQRPQAQQPPQQSQSQSQPQHRAGWRQRCPPPMVALLLTIWLWRHPWEGIWHDNTLYAAQALHWLRPDVFGHDLFFLYGSQAAYTLFTPCYAAAVAALGLNGATLALLACSYVAWIAAAAFLLRSFLQGRAFWLGMVVLFALPSDYGPIPDLLRLAEPFLTPRPFAEALSMAALACALRARLWPATLAALLACLLHPLMGLACAASLLFYAGYAHPWRLAVLLAAGAGAVAAAAGLGVAPFDGLLRQMDADWYARVVDAAYVVAWSAWRGAEWCGRTALAFNVVLAGALLAEGRLRRLLCAIALTGALGLAATWLGTGVYHNVLLMQLQPWRALWLVQLAALCVLPWMVANYWPRGGQFRLLVAAMFLAWLARDGIGAVLAAAAGVALWRQARQGEVAPQGALALQGEVAREGGLGLPWPRPVLLVAAVLVLATVVSWWTTVLAMAGHWMAIVPTPYGPHQYLELLGWAVLKTGGAALALALLRLLPDAAGAGGKPVQLNLFAFGMLCAALLLALATGDRREMSAAYRDPATAAAIRARFLPLIGPSATVYWEDDIQATWFMLERASYAASTQLIGLVFNRGTAIEGYRRLERLQALGVADAIAAEDLLLRHDRVSRLPKTSFAGLVHVCHDPVLDFVVLGTRFQDGVIQQASDAAHQQNFYLYDCALLRGRYADSY